MSSFISDPLSKSECVGEPTTLPDTKPVQIFERIQSSKGILFVPDAENMVVLFIYLLLYSTGAEGM